MLTSIVKRQDGKIKKNATKKEGDQKICSVLRKHQRVFLGDGAG